MLLVSGYIVLSNMKEERYKPETKVACLCQRISWNMAALLSDSVVVVVVRTHPRAIVLAIFAMRKVIHWFL